MSEVVKPREALLGIAIGKKGVGKTYKTLETIQPYLRGNPATGAKPRKVLILDVNNEFVNVQKDVNPSFHHIKAISVDQVANFTHHPLVEARRISIYKENGQGATKTLDDLARDLEQILGSFQNGLLLIEDINKIVSDSMPNDLMGAIVTQRHRSVDIITHFQSVGKAAHPKLWANCNYLRFHKCEDTVKRHESKFGGDVTNLYLLEEMVNNQYRSGNVHFCAYLDKDDGKIKGEFTLETFTKSLESYMEKNYKSVVKPELDRKVLTTGRPVHNSHIAAVTHLKQQFIKDYYGNPR